MRGSNGSARRAVARTALVLAALGGAACTMDAESRETLSGRAADAGELAVPGSVVDSTLPIAEEVRRFRIGLAEATELEGGVNSREALVDSLARRLERADTAGVAALAIDRAEFAWLYYPYTIFVAPPYELSPGILWFQTRSSSSSGLRRLLQRHSGKRVRATGLRCPNEGQPHGHGRVWDGCVVLGTLPGGEPVEEVLFGSIFEWEGRYKLVSFTHPD